MATDEFELLREAFPERPEMGPALSRVLLDQVAAGQRPATVRLSRPGRVVAFGRRDTRSPGYAEAVKAARRAGFAGMERLTGGRAAAYSEGALSLTVTVPDAEPARRTNLRFREAAEIARSALVRLGVDARTGEVEGEYCPGDFSVNARGASKLVGIGQRMIKGAAHIGFVIVVRDSSLIREVLEPVYEALELEWNPETVGAIEDEVPGTTLEAMESSILASLDSDRRLRSTKLDPETLTLTEASAERFRSP
ncbi:MAG: lipoate--protein ligase family protein [Actinomycetota bacterium]|nr:lipoate--protein ligase family protein [Actinomycetota bacterium]